MVGRRVAGDPLEIILGWAAFCGLRVVVEPGVFVPRRRTEFLVRQAVPLTRPGAVVVDLCCGSGALGAALLGSTTGIELHAADLATAAVRCARVNLAKRGQVHQGDLYDALPASLRGRVDVLLANAPYVPTAAIALMPPEARLHEPRSALDGGGDGLLILRRVIAGAPSWLVPGGHLLFETSASQAEAATASVVRSGLIPSLAHSDELESTVVIATRPDR
jgi:release factor glutamine methyltransferase